MKKIVFIEPQGSEANVFDSSMKLPLLGTLYLGTILSKAGHEVIIYNENLLGRKLTPFEISADFVCLTCLSVNAERAKYLAREIKLLRPETTVIIGGIHPSLLPEEFISCADFIVTGEGEGVILDIINRKISEKIIHGAPMENLDELPLPDYSLLKNAKKMDMIPLMASRGCPFDCNFCTVTKIFGKRYRKQSVPRIISEIKNALKFFKTNEFFFYDDNLTADRKRILELAGALVKEKLNIIWTAQVRSDIARDPALLEKMFLSGCDRVYIGFESINDEILKSLHKGQTRNDIEQAIETIHQRGIKIHGMFMFGADSDTQDNITETVAFTKKHEIDTVQFMILTPFPGTKVFEDIEKEGRLLHRNWSFYDGMHAVFKPCGMSARQLQEAAIAAYRSFYSLEKSFLELLFLSFNIFFDALTWDFRQAFKYDLHNMLLKVGARYIIDDFLSLNKHYIGYLADK